MNHFPASKANGSNDKDDESIAVPRYFRFAPPSEYWAHRKIRFAQERSVQAEFERRQVDPQGRYDPLVAKVIISANSEVPDSNFIAEVVGKWIREGSSHLESLARLAKKQTTRSAESRGSIVLREFARFKSIFHRDPTKFELATISYHIDPELFPDLEDSKEWGRIWKQSELNWLLPGKAGRRSKGRNREDVIARALLEARTRALMDLKQFPPRCDELIAWLIHNYPKIFPGPNQLREWQSIWNRDYYDGTVGKLAPTTLQEAATLLAVEAKND